MIKIIAIYDQIQSGMGTKDDRMLPLGGTNGPIGPSMMMDPFLKKINGRVIACFYCGTGTYFHQQEEVNKKICDKIRQLGPDVVLCGPAYHDQDYARMCAELAACIKQSTGVPAIASMSKENTETIHRFKEVIPIIKCPKKGEAGLNHALQNMARVIQGIAEQGMDEDFKSHCF